MILGLKIKVNIAATKLITSAINRPKKISLLMYEVLKISTLPATMQTRLIKYTDMKSRIITIITLVDPSETSSHSKMYSLRFIVIIENNLRVNLIMIKSWPTTILVEDINFIIL